MKKKLQIINTLTIWWEIIFGINSYLEYGSTVTWKYGFLDNLPITFWCVFLFLPCVCRNWHILPCGKPNWQYREVNSVTMQLPRARYFLKDILNILTRRNNHMPPFWRLVSSSLSSSVVILRFLRMKIGIQPTQSEDSSPTMCDPRYVFFSRGTTFHPCKTFLNYGVKKLYSHSELLLLLRILSGSCPYRASTAALEGLTELEDIPLNRDVNTGLQINHRDTLLK